jgi:hypothetical protein
MKVLCVIGLVLVGGVAEAQAPPSLSQLLEHATKQRQAAQAEMLATAEGKRFLAWQTQEQSLQLRMAADAKAEKPTTESK